MNPRGGERALECPIFLLWGKDRRIKVRICANGSVQRAWIQKEGAAIPTAYLEIIMLSSVIDVREDGYLSTTDIPNVSLRHR